MTNQLDIGARQSMVPAASKNFSLNETISGSGKVSDKTDHQPRNLKIQKLIDEIVNDGNSTSSSRPYVVQRKRLFNDSDELFAADRKTTQKGLDESINPPKIHALIDEIINDYSPVKPHDEMKILPQKKSVPPGTVVAAVFQEMAAAGSPTPTEEEKVYSKELPPRTKGDIVGYSDEDSDDETSHKASTNNSSDE